MVQQARYMNLVDVKTELLFGLSWRFLALSANARRVAMLIADDNGERLSWLYFCIISHAATNLNIFPVKALLIAVIGRLEDGLNWMVGRGRILCCSSRHTELRLLI